MSYNKGYNNCSWIGEMLEKLDRKKVEVTFSPHLFDRIEYWNLNFDRIEETIRTGRIFAGNCEEPNKLCFRRYFGKENVTYIVIAIFHESFIEVRTVWPLKGR